MDLQYSDVASNPCSDIVSPRLGLDDTLQRDEGHEESMPILSRLIAPHAALSPKANSTAPSDSTEAAPAKRLVVMLAILYFLGGISASTFGRFSAVYYLSKGLSAFQIGILEAVSPTVRALFGPLWSLLADATNSKKLVSQVNRFLSVSVICCLGVSILSDSFVKILIISGAASVFCGAGSLLDAYALELCGKSARRLYGRIRLWMAVSWGVGSLAMGIVANANDNDWTWNFVIYGAFGLANIIAITVCIPGRTPIEDRFARKGETKSTKDLISFISSFHFISLIIEVILFGAALGVVERLMFVFLVNDLGGNSLLCGMTVFVSVVFEIPIFWHSEWIQNKAGGKVMLSLAIIAYIIRVFGYTLLEPWSRWYILFLEILHGFTFSLMWLYVVDRSNSKTPKGWSGTVQTLVSVGFNCVGTGGGSALGGWLIDNYGARTFYRWAGYTMSGALVVHWVVWGAIWILKRSEKKP